MEISANVKLLLNSFESGYEDAALRKELCTLLCKKLDSKQLRAEVTDYLRGKNINESILSTKVNEFLEEIKKSGLSVDERQRKYLDIARG